jgi:hypothetical protein
MVCLSLAAAVACASSPTARPGTPTEALPIYVFAQCALMGGESRVEVAADRPLVVLWGWTAATAEQMQAYRDTAVVTVRLDGRELTGVLQGEILHDEASGEYRAVWSADAGRPDVGSHELTYRAAFPVRISDGRSDYGPGTARPNLADDCEIIVRQAGGMGFEVR